MGKRKCIDVEHTCPHCDGEGNWMVETCSLCKKEWEFCCCMDNKDLALCERCDGAGERFGAYCTTCDAPRRWCLRPNEHEHTLKTYSCAECAGTGSTEEQVPPTEEELMRRAGEPEMFAALP